MKQYLELLKAIQERGTYKPAARENMPRTQSLFGYQFRHDLSNGFPLLTTKKISFKNVVTEALWFLNGDTNIKYLVDNGCNIWNEDAYNYYKKLCKKGCFKDMNYMNDLSFEDFIQKIKGSASELLYGEIGYKFGDCGYQYGKMWRKLEVFTNGEIHCVDQIKDLIEGLKSNPESRRHIVTAWNPATLNDMALVPCHAMFQFNCRPLSFEELWNSVEKLYDDSDYIGAMAEDIKDKDELINVVKAFNKPLYYLDCQLYQRSADSVLGVPYNIASYALLTHIIAKLCNMIPGEYIHSFGDVHIYDNHKEAVAIQLQREPKELPIFEDDWIRYFSSIDEFVENVIPEQITNCLRRYNPEPSIKAELSTGLIK